jgi:adenylyltransferase/sulfurtransferase
MQVSGRPGSQIAVEQLATRWRGLGEVTVNTHLARLRAQGYELTVFPDGRAIVKGTRDEAVARSLYARYIGM